MQRINLNKILLLVIGYWLLVLAIMYAGVELLPFRPSFANRDAIYPYGRSLLTNLANFDGIHYFTIATKGYLGWGLVQGFFPGYPYLIRILSLNNYFDPIITGVLLSVVCLSLSLIYLFKLISIDESKNTSHKTILLILLFPTSFFFICLYSESLFLLLTVLSFWSARRGKWWLAGMWGMLAAITRLTGIILIPALLMEWQDQKKRVATNWTEILACFLPLAGLLTYMTYLKHVFNDALMFYHVQSQFGAARESNKIILLPRVYFRYLKMLGSAQVNWHAFYTTFHELRAGIMGLALSILAFYKTRKAYATYALLSFLLPTLTGTFSSLGRYLLVIFPLFIVMAKIIPNKIFPIVLVVSAILLIINILLFTQGLWVA